MMIFFLELSSRHAGKFNTRTQGSVVYKMAFTNKIKHVVKKLSGFFSYHYASIRNYHPYKIIGEKYQRESIVICTAPNIKSPIEIPLRQIFTYPDLISYFHPKDAFIIGSAAFEDFVRHIPTKEKLIRFNEAKNCILKGSNNIKTTTEKLMKENVYGSDKNYLHYLVTHSQTPIKNTYPCKIVGGSFSSDKGKTHIMFTSLCRREGHKIIAESIASDPELLSRFRPRDAVKIGFILTGDAELY